ncbi:MAG: CPBP family intramembrane metalloprotease [Eubacteriales bacterium]|nr:CPBP family intramembrane metalloprotease [Eubacteriales bacterium]
MTTQQKIWKGAGTVVKAVVPLFLYIAIPGVLMGIGSIVRSYQGSSEELAAESGNFYNFLSQVLILVFLYRRSRKQGRNFWEETTLYVGELSKQDRSLCIRCALLGASVSLMLSALLTILPLPQRLMGTYETSSSIVFAGKDVILVLINMALLAPLAEEILFRGYMLNRLLTFFPERQAIWISAVIFALCHGNLLWMAYALAAGVFLAWISIRKDNILYPICIHAGFNLPAVLIAVIQVTGMGEAWIFKNHFLVFLYGLIGAAAGRLLYLDMKNRGDL